MYSIHPQNFNPESASSSISNSNNDNDDDEEEVSSPVEETPEEVSGAFGGFSQGEVFTLFF